MNPPATHLDPARLGLSYRSALLDDCVPFWFPRGVDHGHGGFLHCLGRSITSTGR